MQKEERIRLTRAAAGHESLSAAVNADGEPVRGGFVPWENTASAFNMKKPKVTLAAEDLADPEIMAELKACRLIGLYLFTPLDHYDFLSELICLRDLFICSGEKVQSLSFVKEMPDLFMLYLENASLPNLEPLVERFNRGERLPGKCLGFWRCRVEDTSALKKADFIISELLIWPVPGDRKERWKPGRIPGTFRFYEAG